MARLMRFRWSTDVDVGLPRRDRRSCDYDAYVPDLLVDRPITFDGDVAADMADAEHSIVRLDDQVSALVNTEALARILLRAESVASSRIEGLEVGGRRLLRAEMAHNLGEDNVDVTVAEVLGNIDAMAWAIRSVEEGGKISLDQLREIHRRLLTGTHQEASGGHLRTIQNWIGGSDYNPCSAAFVPPPPHMVGELVEDLCAFCNDDSLPAVAQAAIAHAQFETIHPFVDGNGRTGRALIHVVLRRRRLTTHTIVPVSLILATWARSYITGLSGTRYAGDATSPEAHDGLNRWIAVFASACVRAAADAAAFEDRVRDLDRRWRERLGRVRAGSSVDLLLRALPGVPIITVTSASELLNRSFPQVNAAITRLHEADILRQIKVGRRNRAFEAPGIIAAFTVLERQLASPEGDTRVAPPVRAVPKLVT